MACKDKPKHRVVEIEWIDAQSSMDTIHIEDLKEVEPLHTFSAGYLIEDTDVHVILSFMEFGNGFMKHYQSIPKGMIVRMRDLEFKRRRC